MINQTHGVLGEPAHRNFVFWQAMRQFLKDPDDCIHPRHPVLIDLIYGWGNDAWSALDEYLADCIEHALTSRGPILECGSGLSTILLGVIAKRQGQSHWALEHEPMWAKKVQSYLDKCNLDSVVLCSKPLKDYGDYCWYDVPLELMPDRFSLVVCDGPPGSTKGGRYGLVPLMRERLKPGCVILLDDAHRAQELAIARCWEVALGASIEIRGSTRPYIKMTVLGGQNQPLCNKSPFALKKKKNKKPAKPLVNKYHSTISLCMIVKNEESCLERCLKSVRDHVDEIIIVDTGSTDKTVEIAERYNARVYHHPWENDFSKHRNQSLSYATGDWIFQLDADEELFLEDGETLRGAVQEGRADYYHCRFYDMKKDGSVHGVFYLIRLFRNHMKMFYTQKVHNQLQSKGNGAFSSIRIRHYGYDLSKEKMEEKHIRTTSLLKEMLESNPEDAYSRHQLASSYSMHREFNKAIEHGEKALEIMHRKGLKNEFFITTLYTVAQGYYAMGKSEDAERICLKALELFPTHLDMCHILASIYFKKRNPDKCKAISQRYLSIYYDFEKNPSLIGTSYFHSFSKRSEIFFGLACIYFLEKDFDKADTFFQKAFEDSDRRMDKAESICRFYFEQHMDEKALQWLIIVYEVGFHEGKNSDILENEKNLYLKMGKKYFALSNLNAAADCLQRAGDDCLTTDEQIEKRLLQIRIFWLAGMMNEFLAALESLMMILSMNTNRCLDSVEELGQIVYDIAEEFCRSKQWHFAEPVLQLAIQIAPALFDNVKFNGLLPEAEQQHHQSL